MSDLDGHAFVDEPTEARREERIDVESLTRYLVAQGFELSGPLVLKQFRRGHSNLTYMVGDGVSQWVLRRPPFGSSVRSAHDMGREYRILSGLYRAYPKAPRAEVYCDDPDVIGTPFYLMERIEGVILRRDLPKGLHLDEDTVRRLNLALVDNLVTIHAVDLEAAGLTDLGRPEGYVERQVTGWTRRYEGSRTDDIPGVERVATWLAEKLPDSHEGVLIHNDYKHDNLVLDPDDLTRIIGVLDWEMATVGHPLMDLGTTLSYWIQPDDPAHFQAMRLLPTHLPGTPTREEIIERYAEKTGRDIEDFDFYQVFGLFKTAVVAQQIYYRFKTGKTSDPRFEMMIFAVRLLIERAANLVEQSGL